MPEEKKPKIDLKSRLKKTEVSAPAGNGPGSVPPPVVPGAIPGPIAGGIPAPPMSPLSGGIPAPPFAQPAQPAAKTGPVADRHDPLAAVAAPSSTRPAPAEIRVDVGEAAHEAAKAMRKFIAIAGVAGAVIGLAIGFAAGGQKSAKDRSDSAIAGAGNLLKDVEATNKKVEEFKTKLDEAIKTLGEKKFPTTFSEEVSKLSVDFSADKFNGRSVGNMPGKTQTILFQFASDAQALDNRREALQRLFANRKKPIEEYLKSLEEPTMQWGVVLIKDQKGPLARLGPVAAPFKVAGDWPKELSIVNPVNKQAAPVTRYVEGDPLKDAKTVFAVPLDQKSVDVAFPNDAISALRNELVKTRQLIEGEKDSTEDDAKAGLIKLGKDSAEELRKIAAAGK